MNVYDKNVISLKKNHDRIYNEVLHWDREKQLGCSIQKAKNGGSVLCLNIDGKQTYMGSTYNPEKESERFAKQYSELVDYSYMIFVGLGNGMAAKQIIRQQPDNVQFMFYEPSPDVFFFVIHNVDMTEIFENERVTIVVKDINDEDINTLISSKVTLENYKWCIFDALPVYRQLFPNEFTMLKDKYCFLISMVKANIATAGYFGKTEAYNNLRNMRELFHSNCEEDFEGVFPIDRPAIIVAAGPSLEKNVQYLKQAKGKMIIIAVDTAMKYLVSEGVIPDLAVVADPQKPVKLFDDERVRKIPLAIFSGANNEIIRLMEDEKIIFASAEAAYYDRMYEIAGKHMYMLSGGGSVATFAFVLARAWGYSKIVLVGQDLALASDKVHAGQDDIDTHKLKQDKIEIEGYYGDKVYTSPDYDFYRQWYEMVIPQNIEGEQLQVINATEGGAKIAGAVQMPLQEVIEIYKDVQKFDFEKTIREMPCTFNDTQRQEVFKMWKLSIMHLIDLKNELLGGIDFLQREILSITKGDYSVQDVINTRNKVRKIVRKCAECDEGYFVDLLIANEYGDILSDVLEKEDNDEAECKRMFNKMKEYMEAMANGVDEIKALFVELVDTVEKGE